MITIGTVQKLSSVAFLERHECSLLRGTMRAQTELQNIWKTIPNEIKSLDILVQR